MNLKTYIQTQAGPGGNKGKRAVALVITLLFLSVITFLAIAFLSMTRRDRSAVTATLDVDTAKTMSDAALARAQTEIIAQMMAQGDILSYDYTASHNFINPFGFTPGVANANNVNYDYLINGQSYSAASDPADWATNIGNLFYDPRPPVFVMTNGNLANPLYDFRFWVDINRNGRFETNGYLPVLDDSGSKTPPTGPPFVTNFNNGEPEWIGVLKYPEYAHSPTNPFIGRYAFMALPIGKTLDLNFIHNYARYVGPDPIGLSPSMTSDGFIRDEGVGSWELNLAAFLDALSPAMYQTNASLPLGPYTYLVGYDVGSVSNSGGAFDDASQILGFRYGHNMAYPNANYPFSLNYMLGNPPINEISNIDEYGIYPSTVFPFDYGGSPKIAPGSPWPGTYNSNMFYDVQDLFDPNKTGQTNVTTSSLKSGQNFAARLASAMTNQDSYNRYTFQRLLDCIGTSSAPEYGVYVYSNLFTNSAVPTTGTPGIPGYLPPPSWLRTKININYDNTAQIQAGPYSQTAAGPYGPYTPMPTNLVSWTPLGFFTNAAELLLRSQVFVYTNYVTNFPGFLGVYYPSNYLLATFGITNIPVYVATNPGIVYNEQVHRMLQLAANIYAAANPVFTNSGVNRYQQPPVFRPQFSVVPSGFGTNLSVTITNFVQVTNDAHFRISQPFYDLTNSAPYNQPDGTFNFWGVPWVVGAVKGLPAFDQYNYQSRVFYQRQLQFVRKPDPNNPGYYLTTGPLQATNQFYQMSVSNFSGMDAWNPYSSNFYGSGNGLYVVASNYITVAITNNYRFGFITNFSLVTTPNVGAFWPGYPQTGAFQTFLATNFVTLPFSYFSESTNGGNGGFVPQGGNSQSWLPQDTNQTTYPTHYWAVSVTNHLYYVLFDGNPTSGNAPLLDFVNLGPFGRSFPITMFLQTNSQPSDPFSFPPSSGIPSSNTSWWWVPPATDAGTAQLPIGAVNQINIAENNSTQFYYSITGGGGGTQGYPASQQTFYPPPIYIESTQLIGPTAQYADSNSWMACDPLVHYTLGDLIYPGYTLEAPQQVSASPTILPTWTSGLGSVTTRYNVGIANNNIVFGDPGLGSPNYWQFPTNLFPGVGWLGRVHRGTPWQTVYLKSDDPNPSQSFQNWYTTWVNSPFTYPTNDWSIIDLFTAVPNDNAARGLLSVNQTNDAAWAAVFAGVIAITNIVDTNVPTGIAISPTNDIYNFYSLALDSANGIYGARTNQPNGLFHKIGDILQASALTVNSPYLAGTTFADQSDEMVERIPQQTLGLLKLGLPQFVIYSWGQSLKPKDLYSSGTGSLLNICTNYEITGEFLTRTVCHIVSDPGAGAPRIVIDNYNIMPGN
jgi:hypothetical protein